MQATRSIRTRLLLAVLATTFTALLIAAAAMIANDIRDYRRALIEDLSTQADILAQSCAPALAFHDREAARQTLASLHPKRSVVAAALYTARGAMFAHYGRSDAAAATLPALPQAEGVTLRDNEVVLVRRVVERDEVLGSIYLRGEYDLGTYLSSYAAIVGGVFALSMAAGLLMWMWLQSRVTGPILAMRDVAREVVEKRDFALRARKTTDDEIGFLADAFNDMLAEIERRTRALEQSNATLQAEIRERMEAEQARLQAEEGLKRFNAQLEERVRERTRELAAANKELESFSYSVSHDLRAPVRAIAGFSKLLAEQHDAQLDGEARRKLGIVRSEAARMGALIDDLLAFSRLGRQTLQHNRVDMEELVRANVETLNAGHTGALPQVRIGRLPVATGDRSMLAQVWANLISNAYKFSAKKERPAIEVNAISDAREHVYFVRDNGVGFDPRYVAKLFGVFQRLHDAADFPGTGVGLALVQRIVARHGGRVWAQAQPGEGATFYFSLPRRESGPSA